MGTPTIDVMVPSLWRPERLPGVAANIHEATASDHVVTFIAEHDDEPTIAAAKQLEDTDPGVRLVVNDRSRNYAGAINTAVATSQAEWWFAGADDLRFYHDWDAVALAEVALGDDGHPTQPVIGTNDLFNPYVRQGEHATHYLVHRSYIEALGGTPDQGPGVALNEGYDHQYTDTEFIGVAAARGMFRPCLGSVVEHLHFGRGMAPMDDTYRWGQKHVKADEAMFNRRRQLWEAP